uniref:CASK interacting protein 2 n=1 Tax=Sander lucioperca TaxID=283035 RepID=A0A8D0CQB7_SANLU
MGKEQDLLQAVKSGDLPSTQKLLSKLKANRNKLLGSTKRLNVNYQDSDGFSALHHAALTGTAELLSALLEAQATVDVKDSNGMRPLHYAAWQGKPESVLVLLRSGASVNGVSLDGHIPLHLAAQYGHYEVSEMLLQHQSNPCLVNKAKKTPLDLACEFGRVQVSQLLLSSNMVVALLEGERKEPTDSAFTTPLHLAARNGHKDIIQLLLKAGIDINKTTKSGTALHEASLYGKTEVVRLLLDAGVDVNIRNTYNQTALDIVNQFTTSHASRDIKQLLRDATGVLQVRALKDYWNLHDPTALNIRAGDVITVLEQHVDGRWKGHIHDTQRGTDRVGFFPPSIVEVISRRNGQSLTTPTPCTPPPPTWCCRLPMALLPTQVYTHSGIHTLRYTHRYTHTQVYTLTCAHSGIHTQSDLGEWLSAIGLPQYHKKLSENGYDSISIVRDLTWEDLQEIGIIQLGHQKKLMLAVRKLCDIQRAILQAETGHGGTLRRKAPGALHLVAIEPPADSAAAGECSSPHTPKMMTFQDSELSAELQTAMSGHYGGCEDGLLAIRNAAGMSQSQESIETRSRGSGRSGEPPTASVTPHSWSQESLDASPARERNLPEGWDQRVQPQPHKQVPLGTATVFKYPAIPVKPKASAPCGPSPHGSPALKGFSYLHSNCGATDLRASPQQGNRSMTLLSAKKRVQNATRYALSDGEPDEDDEESAFHHCGNVASYATLTRKPGRSQLARLHASPEKNGGGSVGRSQSFAVRARKKGPPPPPPKRLSSVSSTTSGELSDSSTTSSATGGGGLTDSPVSVRTSAGFRVWPSPLHPVHPLPGPEPRPPPAPESPSLAAARPQVCVVGPGPVPESPCGTQVVQQRLDQTSTSLAAALKAVERKLEDNSDGGSSTVKSAGTILDDIGNMFDDLADQLDAMLD